jgi:hypothetical protein
MTGCRSSVFFQPIASALRTFQIFHRAPSDIHKVSKSRKKFSSPGHEIRDFATRFVFGAGGGPAKFRMAGDS